MSNLLEQASLVLIPSGYKEDVVYSEIPLDGSGDMSFTRSSNGTRINSAGLVEVVPWNLITYSEEFNNGGKALVYATIGADVTTAPNGTTTADSLIEDNSNNLHAVYNFGALTYVAGIYNLSCYVKKGIRDWVNVQLYDGTNNPSVYANVNTGVLGTIGSGATATIESIGNGWYRISISATMLSATGGWAIYSATSDGGTTYTGNNGATALYLWGLQINIGSTAKPYFPTTDRLNVPRLTYQNGGGGCPSLLLEKQSTNLILQSEVFDNASWTKAAVSVTANNITSPDGTQNADLLTTTSASICGAYQLISTGSGTFSFSIFAKKGNNNYLALNAQASSANNCTAIFDLSDGTLGEYQTKGTTAYVSHKIENLGNDWYRCTMVLTTTTSVYFFPLFAPLKTGNTFTSSGEPSVASGKTLYLWGCQVEASSYPTSYIPTTSSSATRVADACFKTGISSLIGQTEGTLFADIELNLAGSNVGFYALQVYDSASSPTFSKAVYIELYQGKVYGYVRNTTIQCEIISSTYADNTRLKIAIAYKANDFALYVNGVQIGTDTSGSLPSVLNSLALHYSASSQQGSPLHQAILFPTRLTNAELASLTTI